MKKILVTGAGGYIGSVATSMLLKQGYVVVALDNYSRGYAAPLDLLQKEYGDTLLKVYKIDLRDNLSPIFNAEKDIQAVIHYAALCNVNESSQHPALYFSNNVNGSVNLVDTMVKHGIDKLVFSSTCAVYGESQYVPLDEKHPLSPISVYGESKYIAERVMNWYGKLKNLNYIFLRYFNVCGASDDGKFGDSKNPSFHLVQNAVRGALGIEPFHLTCPTVDTPDKTPIRDYVNVVDLNQAHLLALDYLLQDGKSNVMNLGTGTGNSVLEIISMVEEVTGKKIPISKGQERRGDPAKLVASITKIRKILDWKPEHNLKDSISTLVKWYTTHPRGWIKQ